MGWNGLQCMGHQVKSCLGQQIGQGRPWFTLCWYCYRVYIQSINFYPSTLLYYCNTEIMILCGCKDCLCSGFIPIAYMTTAVSESAAAQMQIWMFAVFVLIKTKFCCHLGITLHMCLNRNHSLLNETHDLRYNSYLEQKWYKLDGNFETWGFK